jgi:hypothetical protein
MTAIEVDRGKNASRFYRRLNHFFLIDGHGINGESDRLYSEIVGWCWDQYGPADPKQAGKWDSYSMVFAFTSPNNALEFKMRWC